MPERSAKNARPKKRKASVLPPMFSFVIATSAVVCDKAKYATSSAGPDAGRSIEGVIGRYRRFPVYVDTSRDAFVVDFLMA